MIEAVIILLFIAAIVIPAVLLWWVHRSRSESKLEWFLVVLLSGAYLANLASSASSELDLLGYFAIPFVTGFLLIVAFGWRKRRPLPFRPASRRGWNRVLTTAGVPLIYLSSMPAIDWYESPERRAVDLEFPLMSGVYYAYDSARNIQHEAQEFGLNIIKVNAQGLRSSVFLPEKMEEYEIFGSQVVAPCEGEILLTEAFNPDQFPRKNNQLDEPLGNYVVLHCAPNEQRKAITLVLGSLKQNSIKVKVGDRVSIKQPLAQVGSSGKSSEPRLQFHAVSGRHISIDDLVSHARAVPARFNGRILQDRDRVEVP